MYNGAALQGTHHTLGYCLGFDFPVLEHVMRITLS
jgi:hypothetical protein